MANIYIQKDQLIKPDGYSYVMDANNVKYANNTSLQDKIVDLVNLIEQKENNI